MTKQQVAVPLVAGVRTTADSLGLSRTVMIGGISCQVLLPQPPPPSEPVFHLAPPASASENGQGWPGADWREILIIKGRPAVTVRAIGLIPDAVIEPGPGHVAFDHAVAGWKHLLRDWLALTVEGPTESGGFYAGAALWGSPEYDYELFRQPYQAGHTHDPRPSSPWAWGHALDHAAAGHELPLARALMATAMQAAADANWRAVLLDAATATEVALTAGLAILRSANGTPADVKTRIDNTRMLGPLVGLAKDLGLALPDRISPDLVKPRNAVIHGGAPVDDAGARAAIAVTWEVVRQHAPLDQHCQEPSNDG